MSFRITGLDAKPFRHLYGLSDSELAVHGAMRYVAESKPGYPDRVELRDVEPGESVLLVNFEHQPVDSPYRSSHAIYVREGANEPFDKVDHVPESMRTRLLSLRAFDARGMMLDADVVEGREIEAVIARLFADPCVDYIHAHNARRGCYAARIDRA
ncbi:MAG TPA: DUF1203 domain-containing protein [Rhizomicrobium sp.]|jgi:hypothetical protein